MNQRELVNILRDHFTEEFHAPREAGWQEMADFLAERTDVSMEQAETWLADLEKNGIINFLAFEEPDAPAMLEAARYGDMPAEGTAEGYWTIGREF